MKTKKLIIRSLLIAAILLVPSHRWLAAKSKSKNKSGVAPQVLSVPRGGGAVRGLRESFVSDLNSGTGSYAVPLSLPAGRNGFGSGLALCDSTGWGNGAFGLGWRLNPGEISRITTKGGPQYDDGKDIFSYNGTDLVASGNGRYRPREEGLFAWIIHKKRMLDSFEGKVAPWVAFSAPGTSKLIRSVGENIKFAKRFRPIANPYILQPKYPLLSNPQVKESIKTFGKSIGRAIGTGAASLGFGLAGSYLESKRRYGYATAANAAALGITIYSPKGVAIAGIAGTAGSLVPLTSAVLGGYALGRTLDKWLNISGKVAERGVAWKRRVSEIKLKLWEVKLMLYYARRRRAIERSGLEAGIIRRIMSGQIDINDPANRHYFYASSPRIRAAAYQAKYRGR